MAQGTRRKAQGIRKENHSNLSRDPCTLPREPAPGTRRTRGISRKRADDPGCGSCFILL